MAETSFLKGQTGVVRVNGDSAPARLTHDSPPDQESVTVELLDSLICIEAGDEIEIQRYEFRPVNWHDVWFAS